MAPVWWLTPRPLSDVSTEVFVQEVSITSRYDAAVSYIRDRRWALIPLHHVLPDGACSCRFAATDPDHQAGGKSVGKHPISKGWQSGPPMSLADAFTIWGDESPEANIGIRTGAVSGIFVLDVDPDNGGHESLIRMVRDNSCIPATFTVRTGSGGAHYYFRLPSAFRITNGANRLLVQKYGPGLDIRGEGGQVVAPPSVSGKGGYVTTDPAEPADAPGWLLELLQATVDTMPVTESPVIEDLPMTADLSANEAARVQRYAERVIEQAETEYLEAPPGSGNQALFTAACSMIEIAQSPWNTITVAAVWERLERARLARKDRHPMGGGQDAQEFSATWESARARVLGQGRALPPDPNAGVAFDPSLFLPEGEAAPEVKPPATRDEAQSLVDQLIARMLSPGQLLELPRPAPLIQGVLDMDSEAWLIGPPGSFKSFVSLDMACHVAMGRAWRGRKVNRQKVIYVVAEGASGIGLRYDAFRREVFEVDEEWMRLIPFPIQAADPVGWATLVAACRRLEGGLIILDTQARVTVGLEENSAKDMGVFIEGVRQIREATSGCVLTVHHSGRNGTDARGSSAIDGAQGTELRIERVGKRADLNAKLIMDKQKDMAEESEGIPFTMKVVDMGRDPETDRPLTSLVMSEVDPFRAIQVQPWVSELPEGKRNVLAVVREIGQYQGLTRAEIRAALKERGQDLAKQTFYRTVDSLLGEEVNGEALLVQGEGARIVVNPVAYDVQS